MDKIVTHKKCTTCGIDQLLSEFPADPRYKLGVRSNCKECYRIKSYKYRKPTGKSENKRVYPPKKPEDKLAKKIARHLHYIKNKVKVTFLTKIYREENPEVGRRSTAKWRQNNPGKHREQSQKRRARQRNVEGTVTDHEWKEICERYGNKCLCCGNSNTELTMDHVIPLDPGTHTADNIQPLCRSCNARKGRKTIDYRRNYAL